MVPWWLFRTMETVLPRHNYKKFCCEKGETEILIDLN